MATWVCCSITSDTLDLPADARARLAALTPAGYTGLAERLAREI